MTPLPYTDTGAQIAFYVTVGVFVLLEQRTRLRSLLNRRGSRSEQGSLLVVIASVAAGVVGAFVLASDVPGAAFTSRNARCSTPSASRTAASPPAVSGCSPDCGEPTLTAP